MRMDLLDDRVRQWRATGIPKQKIPVQRDHAKWRRPSGNRAMVLPRSITADPGFQELMTMVDGDIAAMRREAAAELMVTRAPLRFRPDASYGR
jgi:hypothetical protein